MIDALSATVQDHTVLDHCARARMSIWGTDKKTGGRNREEALAEDCTISALD
jgi:hypothetical protein